MSDMWMPAHTTVPPRSRTFSACGHERAGGGEDDRGVERFRRRVLAGPGPRRAERARELLRALVALAGEGVDGSALVDGDLADHVRRRAEAVQTEARGVAGETQRAVTDQPAAQQRGRALVGEVVGQRQAEALIGDRVLGEAAVDVAAGEPRVQAEVLAPGGAESAVAIGPAKPRDADAPTILGLADDLVAQDNRQFGGMNLFIAQVQIGAAHPARLDLQQQLAGPRRGVWKRCRLQWSVLCFEHDGAHRLQ